MKKDVVGMDRPASEEGPTLEERVEYIRTECIQHWNAMEQRVAKLETRQMHDLGSLVDINERVAELENDSNHRMDLEDDVIKRVARLEEMMKWLLATARQEFEEALNEPLPWGDLD